MPLIEFAPGEGSRYIVTASLLTPREATLVGWSLVQPPPPVALIGFGADDTALPPSQWWFSLDSKNHPYLEFDWFAEKMRGLRDDPVALCAAHWVVAYLLGRNALHARHTPIALGWDSDWQAQLKPLRDALTAELRVEVAPRAKRMSADEMNRARMGNLLPPAPSEGEERREEANGVIVLRPGEPIRVHTGEGVREVQLPGIMAAFQELADGLPNAPHSQGEGTEQ